MYVQYFDKTGLSEDFPRRSFGDTSGIMSLFFNKKYVVAEVLIMSTHSELEKTTPEWSQNKRQKDCLWKQRTHYGLENGILDFIETLHKQ